jgi:hypothetical protein
MGIAYSIIIAIFVTALTTTIAVILLYVPTAFHLLPLPCFVFAVVNASFTSTSASLAWLHNSV